jgi:hypothetical protein
MMHRLIASLRNIFHRKQADHDLNAEIHAGPAMRMIIATDLLKNDRPLPVFGGTALPQYSPAPQDR